MYPSKHFSDRFKERFPYYNQEWVVSNLEKILCHTTVRRNLKKCGYTYWSELNTYYSFADVFVVADTRGKLITCWRKHD
jgi:hypothetical protein